MKTILLDNGHGIDTPGKRSPVWSDGTRLFEYEFNRDIVRRIKEQLPECIILVPEVTDISLQERCRRANEYDNAILLSIHANAGGGTGWECYTSKGNTRADYYATILCNEVEKAFPNERMRFDMGDGDPDKEESFYILKHTKCPAILSENFFMDTEKDCRLIMSEKGRKMIADFHVNAIKQWINLT